MWDELAQAFQNNAAASVAKVRCRLPRDVLTRVQIDCTLYQAVCTAQQIRGYPTLLLFKDGQKIATYSGARDLASLTAYLNEAAQGKHDEL